MRQNGIKLGKILVEDGLLTQEQLDLALQIQKSTGDFLGEILIKRAWISESQLLTALSQQFNFPFVLLDFKDIDWEVPQHYAILIADQHCFPFAQDDDSVTVAIYNPLDAWTMSRIESQAKERHVKLVLSTKTKIHEAVSEFRKRSLNEKWRECA